MEVSRERKNNLILKKKGKAAVWRKVRDGFGSSEFRSWRFLERDSVGETRGKDKEKIKGPAAQRRGGTTERRERKLRD